MGGGLGGGGLQGGGSGVIGGGEGFVRQNRKRENFVIIQYVLPPWGNRFTFRRILFL